MGRLYYDNTAYYEARDKLSQPDGEHCIICGKDLPKFKRKYCSEKCFDNWYFKIAKPRSWQQLRNKFLKENPKCIKCGDKRKFIKDGWGNLITNLQVDHIVSINKGGEEFDWNNLQTLCLKCHKAKHSKNILDTGQKTLKDFKI